MTNDEKKWIRELYMTSPYANQVKTGFDWEKGRYHAESSRVAEIVKDSGKSACAGCGFKRKIWPRKEGGKCKKCRKEVRA